MGSANAPTRRPALARQVRRLRSWLFVEGANEEALRRAGAGEADVLIQEFEDFTPPPLRPRARYLAPGVLAAWHRRGKVACVRINPLEADGLTDLAAVMPGRPDAILLPKVNEPHQVQALEAAILAAERALDIDEGHTAIVPNVEQARGLVQTFAIASASARIVACLVASEDMAADLGAERAPDGRELDYVRARFHAECVAAGIVSIDCPYTFSDADGILREARDARRLGYVAKSAVALDHPPIINRVFTPDAEECRRARAIVEAFEAARERGEARVELDGALVEVPGYQNARRLLERARILGVE